MSGKNRVVSAGLVSLCAIGVLAFCGCISGRSDVTYGPKGPAVSNSTLRHIRCGETSKERVLGTLGAPSSETATPEGTEILRYEYSKETDVDFTFCPFMDFDDKKEERIVYFFEIRDGTVIKFWRD